MSDDADRVEGVSLANSCYIHLYEDGDVLIGKSGDISNQIVLEENQSRELGRLLQGTVFTNGDLHFLGKDSNDDMAGIEFDEPEQINVSWNGSTIDISGNVTVIKEKLIEWGLAFERPTSPEGGIITHDDREECASDEHFTGTEIDSGLGDDGGDVKVYCPVCGRTYDYVYELVGLWDPEDSEYVYEL